ncbi:MAG: hypothetical protein ACREGR_02375 [Minisyncoccia bacterium]
MRIIAELVFFVLAAAGLILAVHGNFESGLAASPESTTTIATFAILSGTIDYYPNNVGTQVPYLVYREGGAVATRALVFGDSSVCATAAGAYPCPLIADALSAYYGGVPVEAEGTLDDENLLVSHLAPA